jgi:hypothetical protein
MQMDYCSSFNQLSSNSNMPLEIQLLNLDLMSIRSLTIEASLTLIFWPMSKKNMT